MNNLKGTRTEANLFSAFAGESQAYMKYTLYAEKAKEDGFIKVERKLKETAENEKAHAEMWLKHIHNNIMPNTLQNLADASGGEHFEWSEMYAQFANEAREEGFEHIAILFESIANVENRHEQTFTQLSTEIENGTIFKSTKEEVWECLNCGHYHRGTQAPQICPVCEVPQDYFKKEENQSN